jgi:pimeloyl-ACP methyl ester carboxylesterase
MTEYVASTDGTRIAYECAGAGPAVVLAGGAFSTRASMRPLARLLSGRFTVFAYDRRGRGDSDATAWVRADQQVEDLLAVAALAGRVSVFGHSSGGILGLLAAAESPTIRRLAVYEPPLLTAGGPDATSEPFGAELKVMLKGGRDEDATVAWFTRTSGGHFDERLRSLPWWPALVGTAHTLPDETALIGDGGIPPVLRTIAISTLLVYGEASQGWARSSAAAISAVVRGAEVVGLPEQGHAVQFDALAPVLERFFLR